MNLFKRKRKLLDSIDPAVDAQKRIYPGISTETARRWAAEDAAFARMAHFVLMEAPGSCGEILRTCPDLTRLAMESFGESERGKP